MENLIKILNPAIISVIVTSIVAPFIFYFLKRRDEIKKRNFEVRYAEYKKYLNTLENISSLSRISFEKDFMEIAKDCFSNIISNPQESNAALIKLNTAMEELTSKLRTSFTQAQNELHGLKLVCSQKLLFMINEFVSLQNELVNKSTEFMRSWKKYIGKEQSFFENSNFKLLGQKANSLQEDILKQMRMELKIK